MPHMPFGFFQGFQNWQVRECDACPEEGLLSNPNQGRQAVEYLVHITTMLPVINSYIENDTIWKTLEFVSRNDLNLSTRVGFYLDILTAF